MPKPDARAAAVGRRALMKACEIAGGQLALGREIGRKQSTIWDWLQTGLITDVDAVLRIEKATGVSRHKLRPDLSYAFGPPHEKHGT
jgi:DNA-binding transcriptional regulator YdaS (Cro superfamily)